MKQSIQRYPRIGCKPCLLLLILVIVFQGQPALGKSETRSHSDVWLKNEQGERITPGRNASDPYSPRRTCGSCHGYAAITSGYHFQQELEPVKARSTGPARRGMSRVSLMIPFSEGLSQPNQGGLPLYDWIGAGGKIAPGGSVLSVAAGWFHPGGGILEYGRKADGTLDLSATLSLQETRRDQADKKTAGSDLLSSFAPDGKSHFRESGVLEADCLICHMARYRIEERNREIQKRNYRWAATAGAGLGRIDGAVFSYINPQAGPGREGFQSGTWNFSRRPVVRYEWGRDDRFTSDGKLKGSVLAGTVRSQNCLRCHGIMEAALTGSDMGRESDIHAKAGFQCTDCHVLLGGSKTDRLKHRFAGKSVRGSGTNALQTCISCHLKGRYQRTRSDLPAEAKRPTQAHVRKFPRAAFHFYVVSCAGCHATAQARRGAYLFDMSSGEKIWYTADNLQQEDAFAELAKAAREAWKPWIERVDSGDGEGMQYAPYLPRVGQWFGRRLADGKISPIPLQTVREAVRGVKGISAGRKSIGSPEDIRTALESLHGRGHRDAVFIADHVYELKKGKLEKSKTSGHELYPSSGIHHNIVPLQKGSAYGSKGCLSCHGKNSDFFVKMNVVNPGGFLKQDYPKPKEPNAIPQMREWGFTTVPSAMTGR